MKKRGMMPIVLVLFLLAASTNVFSLESCNSIGTNICSSSQICEGDVLSYGAFNECCKGLCVEYKQLSCNQLSSANLKDRIGCESKTFQEKVQGSVGNYPAFFANWINHPVPAKPYPKMWDFWFNVSFALGALFLVLTTIGLLGSFISGNTSVSQLDKFRRHYILTFLSGLILLSFPYIMAIVSHVIDSSFLLIVRLFISNGDIIAVFNWLTSTPYSNILFLLRDILYFLFLIVLILRYVVLYLLFVFLPIIIMLYAFYYTEYIGEYLLRKIVANMVVPLLWIFSMAISYTFFRDFSPFFLPILLAAIFYLNIIIYRKVTRIDFSFRALARKTIRYVRVFYEI